MLISGPWQLVSMLFIRIVLGCSFFHDFTNLSEYVLLVQYVLSNGLIMSVSFLINCHGPTMAVVEVLNIEKVVLGMKSGSVCHLNPTLAAVWNLIVCSFSSKKCTCCDRETYLPCKVSLLGQKLDIEQFCRCALTFVVFCVMEYVLMLGSTLELRARPPKCFGDSLIHPDVRRFHFDKWGT